MVVTSFELMFWLHFYVPFMGDIDSIRSKMVRFAVRGFTISNLPPPAGQGFGSRDGSQN